MSWVEKETTQFVLITGDGTAFLPDYLIASVSKELRFNISKFEFRGIAGSFVQREQPMGMAYDIEIIFQGANHLDTSDAFLKSSKDRRAWKITHPLYGGLTVQPINIRWNNGDSNITRINTTVIETILSGTTTPVVSAPDHVSAQAIHANAALANTYANNLPTPSVSDIQALTANINSFFNGIKSKIVNAIDYQGYLNLYNQVNTLINNSVYDSLSLIATAQDMINMPAYFTDTLANRFNMLIAQMELITAAVATTIPSSQKKLFENNGGSIIAALCLASVTGINSTDYANRTDVINTITNIISQYNKYLTTLDALQTLNGGDINSYIPNPDALFLLYDVVNYTVNNLFDIANNAKQERIYMVPENTNVVLLAYELYGLQPDDSTIDTLIATNNIVGYELLQIQKGRQIIYYV